MRSIVVAFSDAALAHKIRDILQMHGLIVRSIATSGSMTLRSISQGDGGGLVVCGAQFQDMSAVKLLQLLPEDYDVLVLASAGFLSMEHQEGLYLLQAPLMTQDLVSSVRMLLETRQLSSDYLHNASQKRAGKTEPLQRSIEEKRLINRAKALLMDRYHMSEQEAHQFLQKKSMENGLKLVDMAAAVLERQGM